MKGLQYTENAPVWIEEETRWNYEFQFDKTTSPSLQIHHNGKYHWVVSILLDGQIACSMVLWPHHYKFN
jgi:hypothetical protein